MSARGWLLFAHVRDLGDPVPPDPGRRARPQPRRARLARTAGGAVLLLPVASAAARSRRCCGARWVLVFAVVEIAVPWLLLSSAERRITSSLAGLLIAAVPLVGALIAWATGARERLGATSLAGLLLGLGGVAALVGLDSAVDAIALVEIAVVVVGYAVGPAILASRLGASPRSG